MDLKSRAVEVPGRGLELVLTTMDRESGGRLRLAPRGPLDAGRLIAGGALSGPMFEVRLGPLARLARSVRRLWTAPPEFLPRRKEQQTDE